MAMFLTYLKFAFGQGRVATECTATVSNLLSLSRLVSETNFNIKRPLTVFGVINEQADSFWDPHFSRNIRFSSQPIGSQGENYSCNESQFSSHAHARFFLEACDELGPTREEAPFVPRKLNKFGIMEAWEQRWLVVDSPGENAGNET